MPCLAPERASPTAWLLQVPAKSLTQPLELPLTDAGSRSAPGFSTAVKPRPLSLVQSGPNLQAPPPCCSYDFRSTPGSPAVEPNLKPAERWGHGCDREAAPVEVFLAA